jgi:hypothetical protein
MKRLLTNNPVGPLPNVRLRYLDSKVVDTYLQSLVMARSGDRGRVVPRIGSFVVWLKRNRPGSKLPLHVRQVGLVDRFADRPYGTRNY